MRLLMPQPHSRTIPSTCIYGKTRGVLPPILTNVRTIATLEPNEQTTINSMVAIAH